MPETPASSPDSTSAQSPSVAAAASQTSVAVLGTQQLIPPSSATLVRSSRKGPKRFSHKVRTGCITCKIRRVKCDETRPACLRCKNTGRVCDGYRFGNEDAPGLTAAVPDSSSRIIVPAPTVVQPGYMPTTHAGWTPSEKRALDFYLRFSVPYLFSGVARSFWGRVIPALCQQEPAIRHAVFAVSSLHENLFCGTGLTGGRPSMNYFATVSYGKALRSLQTWKVPLDRKGAGAASLALPLVACALFICIEFMRGDPAAALLHISQGRRILARLDAATMASPAAELMRREIAPVFSKLAVASFMTGADPEPIPSLFRWTDRRAVGKMEFADMREAEQAIFEIVDDGLRFAKTARFWQHTSGYLSGDDVRSPKLAALEERREQLLSLARRWSTAFAALQASTPEPLNQVPVMYLHAANVVVGMALDRREMCYDDYTAEFANMVLLGKNVLDAEDARNNSAGRNAPATTAFTFDSGLIPPLYFTVLKSRHPGLRRDALALLQRHSAGCHKENVWDSKQASKVAERMITLEEHRGWKIVGKVGSNPLPGASRKLSLHEKKVGEIAVDWMPSLFDEDGKPQERSGAHQLRVQPARRPILGHDSGAPTGGLPTFTDPGISPRDFSELRRFLDGPQQPVHPALAEEAWAALTRSSPLQYQGSHTGADDLATRWTSIYDVPVCLRVPQEARIHNTIVDPGVDGGLWTSFFVEPDRFDPSRVGILREFIPLG